MVMKKGRRVAMESSPSSTSCLVGERARAWFRHQSLLQDYEELLKVRALGFSSSLCAQICLLLYLIELIQGFALVLESDVLGILSCDLGFF